MRGIRGAEIAMIFQEPMTALNPLFTVGNQIGEVLETHLGLHKNAARERAIELLRRTGIPEPERRVDNYPHQLSGGQRQRAMIAMALACEPKLLICDEPTTALDVTVQAQIVALARRSSQAEMGMALLFITHDLNLVRRFTQRVGVMERGKLVEVGATESVFAHPQHAYTKKLLASRPQREVQPLAGDAPILLAAKDVGVTFSIARGWFDERSFDARPARRAAAAARRDARHRRRIGLGQDDARHGAARPAADLGRDDRARRPAHRRRRARRAAGDEQARPGRVPGSLRVAQPAHDGRADRRRRAGAASRRPVEGRARRADRRDARRGRA